MEYISVFIICLLLISAVSGEEDVTCKAGYGMIGTDTRTSGSQCSGVSKITTEAECKLAAEYNRKNNIDKNRGFIGRVSYPNFPPGCFYFSDGSNKYYWNDDTTSTTKCSNSYKCICKTKTCIKCPINTYSKGGINPTCTPCPKDRPTTNFKTGQSNCIHVPTITCEAGHGFINDGITKKKECTKCKTNTYSAGGKDIKCTPCPKDRPTTNFKTGQTKCISVPPINCAPGKGHIHGNGIIVEKRCTRCKLDHISNGGNDVKCKSCGEGMKSNRERTLCYDPNDKFDQLFKTLDQQKEKQNDLSIKNSRLWQKEQIRLHHDKYMQDRKSKDNEKEKESCEKQRLKGTFIFPAIEISNEIEKIEDTTCIDTNRDELLKSFCSFTSDLDHLFQIQNIDKEAKTVWPNICCKERRDTTLEACDPPKGSTIKRENIIPFALSQGGDYSRHNLYVEVTNAIKKNGYLHNGMLKLLDSLHFNSNKIKNAKKLINSFFKEVSLCGPRIVDKPGAKDKQKLCELFVPYEHSMTQFYNLIKNLYYQPLNMQQSLPSSFLQTMETSLRKRQLIHSKKQRIGNNMNTNMKHIMQAKPIAKAPKAEQLCNHKATSTKWTSSDLVDVKKSQCNGYNHIDLSINTGIQNIAIHYLENDLAYDNKTMFNLEQSLRYEIKDEGCPAAPLFNAKDISIQQVYMDTLGTEKEWVAVVNLNTKAENGYLQNELPYCEDRDYLIGSNVVVKAYIDNTRCCKHLKDVDKCKRKIGCENVLSKLKDKKKKHYSTHIALSGTQFKVTSSGDERRRRLLEGNNGRQTADRC